VQTPHILKEGGEKETRKEREEVTREKGKRNKKRK
jgi:hypothetical protein